MSVKFWTWIGAIVLGGMMLLWGTHCGYERLQEVQEEAASESGADDSPTE